MIAYRLMPPVPPRPKRPDPVRDIRRRTETPQQSAALMAAVVQMRLRDAR